MREIELKLLLSRAAETALRDNPALTALSEGAPRRRRLRSVYYDTRRHGLWAAGLTLRLREDGRRWLQTVKCRQRAIAGGLSAPLEAEAFVDGPEVDVARIPDRDLRRRVRGIVGKARLIPTLETVMIRESRLLVCPGGRVELAIDEGEVIAAGRANALREAELELIEGAPALLYDLAKRLFRAGPLRFSTLSKAARGYALARGEASAALNAPRRAREARLLAADSVEAALLKALDACLDQISANVAACVAGDDLEGPHQLRVGLRRLRSVFLLFREALDGAQVAALKASARELGAAVGALRDLDVLIEETLRPAAAQHADAAGYRALLGAFEARRARVRADLRARLAGADTQAFLFDLARFTALCGWRGADAGLVDRLDDRPSRGARRRGKARDAARPFDAPALGLARRALARRWDNVRAKAEGLEDLDVEQRHDLRKALKKLRYGVDFFGRMFPARDAKPFRKRLKTLQDVFGALNDLAAAEAALTGPDAPLRDDPAAQRAVGRVLGARTQDAAHMWRKARADWDRLCAGAGFWR